MKTYEIKAAVRGEHHAGGKVMATSFGPGTVKPKNAAEEKVLKRLVALGLAEEAAPKKKAKPSEEQES